MKSFLAVAKTLNFTRAAKSLHLSQPALSTQIKALEDHLGAQLFLRSRRQVSLTPAGQVFLIDAEMLLKQIAEVEWKVQRISSGDIGHLRIGFVASATLNLVPAIAQAFKKQYPGVSFELKNLPTVQQMEALRQGTLDVGFVRMPLEEKDLDVTVVAREPFAVALPKRHPLAGRAELQVRDLAGEDFISYAERLAPAFYQRWTGLCRKAGFTPNIIQETSEMDTAAALVAAGLGVAILPEEIAKRHRRLLAFTVLSKERIRSEIGVASVIARQTPLVKRLVAVARQVGIADGTLIKKTNH